VPDNSARHTENINRWRDFMRAFAGHLCVGMD
jgi:hypothetical protein